MPALIIIAILALACLWGYGLNMVKLQNNTTNFTGRDALRVVGIVIFPIGVILGYVEG